MGVLTQKQGNFLISIARSTIQAKLDSQEYTPQNIPEDLNQKQGVFCTLKTKLNVLRGCIGLPYPVIPLAQALQEAAIGAAFQDPRFKPLGKDEKFKIEITVLTKPELFTCQKQEIPKKIILGKHGIIVKKENSVGLLLPQVATESRMSAIEFLEATCWKAGLPSKAWEDLETDVLFFEGQVFEEQ